MEKTDLRTLSGPVREQLRKRGIALVKSGKKKGEVALLLGVDKNTVTNWCKAFGAKGEAGLKEKRRGVQPGSRALLTPAQQRKIQAMITDTMPDQLKLAYALWTAQAVAELVEREFNVKVSRTTMGEYLRKWGFTPQKPKRKAYEQCPVKVQKWLDEEYPAIKERAKAEGAEIQWGDETGGRNDCQHGRSYAPKGRTPTREIMAKRFSVNMISSVTNQGKVQFMVYSDKMNSERLIEFMTQLVKGSDRKIYLILDNLRVHHSKAVKQWLEGREDVIEVYHLPSYSPEKNPDEYLNCDLKQGMSARPSPKTAEKLRENVEDHMNMLVSSPDRVVKYFRHEQIRYAA